MATREGACAPNPLPSFRDARIREKWRLYAGGDVGRRHHRQHHERAIIAEMHGTFQDALLRSTSRELAGAFSRRQQPRHFRQSAASNSY